METTQLLGPTIFKRNFKNPRCPTLTFSNLQRTKQICSRKQCLESHFPAVKSLFARFPSRKSKQMVNASSKTTSRHRNIRSIPGADSL